MNDKPEKNPVDQSASGQRIESLQSLITDEQQNQTSTGLLPEKKIVDDTKRRDEFVRAAHEDDDGYDPWSDRAVPEPFWEKDPWY